MANTDQPNGEWKYGLCSCCDSFGDVAFAYCCGPCYNFTAAQAAGEDTMCSVLVCLCPIGMCCVRGNARSKQGISGGGIGDCCITYFCHCCSAIQIKREFTD